MKLLKKIALWFAVAIFAFFALGSIPSISCILAIITAFLLAPIDKWQSFVGKYLNKTVKTIVVIVLAIAMLAMYPSGETTANGGTPNENPTTSQTVTVPTKDPTTTTTAPTEAPTKAPTDAPTEAPTTVPTEVPTAAPTEKPTDAPTEAPTVAPTEAPTTILTEAPNKAPTEAPTELPTDPPHIHSFSAVTCTKPETCSCGETKGSPNGHSYAGGICTECGAADPDYSVITYVLNTKTKKFHKTSCSYLPDDNRQDTNMSRDEIIEEGYEPCKRCHP